MKQDFDLHLFKKTDKSSHGGIRKMSKRRCLAVLLAVVLAAGTCLPAMAVEQPQTEESSGVADAQAFGAAAEEAAPTEEPLDSAEVTTEGTSDPADVTTEGTSDPADVTTEGASDPSEVSTEGTSDPAEVSTEGASDHTEITTEGTSDPVEGTVNTEDPAAGADAAGNGNSGDLDGAVPAEEQVVTETTLNSVSETSSVSGGPLGPNDSSWLRYFDFSIDGDTVVLSGSYTGSESDVTIPGEATIDGVTYKVRITSSIYWNACSNLSFDEGVEFPDDCSWLFNRGWNLSSIDMSNIDTSSVVDMSYMFCGLEYLTDVNLSGVDTSNVTNMAGMFQSCNRLTSLDVSGFNMSNVQNIDYMFYSCYSLKELDLSSWSLNCVNSGNQFCGQQLKTIKTPLNLYTDVYLDGSYKDSEGTLYDRLPMMCDTSIILTRDSDEPGWLDAYGYSLEHGPGYNNCRLQTYIGDASEVKVPGSVVINGTQYTVCAEDPSIWSNGVTSLSFEEGFRFSQMAPYFGFGPSTDLKHLDLQHVDMSGCSNLNISELRALETIETPVGFGSSISLPSAFEDAEGNIYASIPANMEESITLTRAEASAWLNDYQYSISDEKITLDRYVGDGGTVTIKGNATVGSKSFDTIEPSNTLFQYQASEGITQVIYEQGVVLPSDYSGPFWRIKQLNSIDFSGADFSNIENANNMISGCRYLTTIQTPANLSVEVFLPGAFTDESGKVYTSLPMNLGESITLTKSDQQSSWLTDFSYHIDGNKIVLTGGYYGSESDYTVSGNADVGGQHYDIVELSKTLNWDIDGTLSFETGVVFPENSAGLFSNENVHAIDLTNVDAANCRSMEELFSYNWSLTSVNMGGIDTSKVTDMSNMFTYCDTLQHVDFSGINTSSVTNMLRMFSYCRNLSSLDLSGFDTSHVTDMSNMFYDSYIGELDIRGWDLSSLNITGDTPFSGDIQTIHAPAGVPAEVAKYCILNRQYTGSDGNGYWYLPENSDTDITLSMIAGSISGDPEGQDPVIHDHSPWLNDYSYYIAGDMVVLASGYCGNQADVTIPGTAEIDGTVYHKVQITRDIIWECENLSFDQGVIFPADCTGLFSASSMLKSIDITNVDTSEVTSMWEMFSSCDKLETLNLTGIDTSNVTTMKEMFSGCAALTELDLSGLNTTNVNDMEAMFSNCTSLTELDLSGLNTSHVTTIERIFENCNNLSHLDLSSWDLSSLVYGSAMLDGNGNLKTIEAPLGVPFELALGASYMGADGYVYQKLPLNLTTSITLTKIDSSTSGNPYDTSAMSRITFDTVNCDIAAFAYNSYGIDGTEVHDGDYVYIGTYLSIRCTPKPGCYMVDPPAEVGVAEKETIITAKAAYRSYELTVKNRDGDEDAAPAPTANVGDLDHVLYGTSVTLTAGEPYEGCKFIGWYQPNGKLLTSDKQYTFMMYGNTTCEAWYQASSGTVTFVSNDKIVKSVTVSKPRSTKLRAASGGIIDGNIFPDDPIPFYGFEFAGWDKGTDEINAELASGQNVTVTAQFREIQQQMTLTIYNQEQEEPETRNYTSSQWVYVTARPVEGKNFAYWTMNGELLSNNSTAIFLIGSDCEIRAVYTEDIVEPVGTAVIKYTAYDATTCKMKTEALLTVPEGAVITKAGLFAASSKNFDPSNQELDESTADYVKASSKAVGTKGPVSYTWTKSNVNKNDIWYLRAYVSYTYNGKAETILGNTIEVIAGSEQ